jgi:hypothetical protein
VVSVIDHGGVVARSQKSPGMREMINYHRIVGIDALNFQLRE